MIDKRPDPDALLERMQAQEAVSRKGKLKIFFGASPGVGKTYAMLEAAHAKKTEGLDVVVGLLETHGRKETADLWRDGTSPAGDVNTGAPLEGIRLGRRLEAPPGASHRRRTGPYQRGRFAITNAGRTSRNSSITASMSIAP